MTGATRNPVAVGVLAMLLVALATFANLAGAEFGRLSHQPLHIDEMSFASCAARAWADGTWLAAGCHDNKGPVIFMVHRIVQAAAGKAYDFVAIKRAAFLVVMALCGLTYLLARRFSGRLAGVAAMALLLQALSTHATFFALKTETVGTVFVMWGLVLIVGPRGRMDARPLALLLGAALMGMALLTRQTFALVPLMCFVWLLRGGEASASIRTRAGRGLLFAVGGCLPLAVLFFVYRAGGLQTEYLASLFIYPMVRAVPTSTPLVHTLIESTGLVLATLSAMPLLCSLFAASVVRKHSDRSTAPALRLIQVAALLSLLVILVSPSVYRYHVVPALPLMAVPAGLALEEVGLWLTSAGLHKQRLPLVGLGTLALLAAAFSWDQNGRENSRQMFASDGLPESSRGAYAYALDYTPQFYAMNGLIPASSRMFPWAIETLPDNFEFHRPDAGSRKAALLAWAEQGGAAQLLNDFRRTPPRYILLLRAIAHAKDSARLVDVPGFDAYLSQNCVFERDRAVGPDFAAVLYRCNAPAGG